MCSSDLTRSKWTATTQERGLVYCEDGQCILVPTVCRNVSRIRRLEKPAAVAPARAANVASSTRESEEMAPLEFDPPAAGPVAAAPASFASQSGVPTLGSLPAPVSIPGGGGPGLISIGMPPLPPATVRTTDSPHDVLAPAVPEPGTWAMIALGLLVVIFRARQKR